ncbi:TatD family deoxyribonuclease [Lacibacter luteus]|uniref:TatD family deoxyribonuclease n=1 Tax=Lacibacter luteus TaxID=2508719 RepID=A0A4Q1CNN3_9BACT|nr:TatD family hydrolase [Lacibacter luteus]RXK62747.1 TatD family deoxyribonuclease [Lacibacter luteus]
MYINVHTHHTQPVEGIISIGNLYKDFDVIDSDSFYSVGLHPWFITEDAWQQQFETVKEKSRLQNVLAIGEAGLDKVCATDFALQQTVFAAHIQLANESQKPLIVHCVRAHAEAMSLLKQHNVKVPVLFHGFTKSKELALQLMAQGYYLSFGHGLMKENLRTVLAALPIEQLLLETDNSTASIEEIYTLAAEAFQIDKDSLSLQLLKNATRVFGAAITER